MDDWSLTWIIKNTNYYFYSKVPRLTWRIDKVQKAPNSLRNNN